MCRCAIIFYYVFFFINVLFNSYGHVEMSQFVCVWGVDGFSIHKKNSIANKSQISDQITLSMHEDVFYTNMKKKHVRNWRASLGRDYSKVPYKQKFWV